MNGLTVNVCACKFIICLHVLQMQHSQRTQSCVLQSTCSLMWLLILFAASLDHELLHAGCLRSKHLQNATVALRVVQCIGMAIPAPSGSTFLPAQLLLLCQTCAAQRASTFCPPFLKHQRSSLAPSIPAVTTLSAVASGNKPQDAITLEVSIAVLMSKPKGFSDNDFDKCSARAVMRKRADVSIP